MTFFVDAFLYLLILFLYKYVELLFTYTLCKYRTTQENVYNKYLEEYFSINYIYIYII